MTYRAVKFNFQQVLLKTLNSRRNIIETRAVLNIVNWIFYLNIFPSMGNTKMAAAFKLSIGEKSLFSKIVLELRFTAPIVL